MPPQAKVSAVVPGQSSSSPEPTQRLSTFGAGGFFLFHTSQARAAQANAGSELNFECCGGSSSRS